MAALFFGHNYEDTLCLIPRGGVSYAFSADDLDVLIERLHHWQRKATVNVFIDRLLEDSGQTVVLEDDIIVRCDEDEAIMTLLALDGQLSRASEDQPLFCEQAYLLGEKLISQLQNG